MQNTPPSTPAKTAQLQPKQITTKCPTCKNNSVAITDVESGEIICSKCGIVITERIEEWHIFSAEEINTKTRTGSPNSLARHDRGLYTIIGQSNRDAAGTRIDSAMHLEYKRLMKSKLHINS